MPERLTDAEKVERLERRVAELEDTVLYLAQTLGTYGVLSSVEVGVARRMYEQRHSHGGGRR